MGENELRGTVTRVLTAQKIDIELPSNTTAVESVKVNGVELTDNYQIQAGILVIADLEPLIQTATETITVTISGTEYTVKF